MENATKLDSNEQIFFERELTTIKARSYDVLYPELKARQLFPVSYDANTGDGTIVYEQYDQVGFAKVIANYAKDFARADIKGKEFSSIIRSLGSSYGYSIQDIRAAAKTGKPLQQRKANAAKRAIMQLENTISLFGDKENDIPGFLSNPNIPIGAVINDGLANSTLWKDKTPDQIIRDLNQLVSDIVLNSKGVEQPNVVLLPIKQYNVIASTPRSSTSDTTILSFFKAVNPLIQSVEWLIELAGVGPGGEDMMLAYNRNPDKLTLEIPQEFEQFPAEQEGMEFVVDCHERIGGVIIYYPLAANKLFGI